MSATQTTNRQIQKPVKGQLNADATIANGFDAFDLCIPFLIARLSNIDATATGATTLYTVPAGFRLIVTSMILRTVSVSSASGNPSISAGGNSSSFDDFSPNVSRDLDTPGNTNISYLESGDGRSYVDGTEFSIKVNSGGTAFGMIIAADLFGYLVPA